MEIYISVTHARSGFSTESINYTSKKQRCDEIHDGEGGAPGIFYFSSVFGTMKTVHIFYLMHRKVREPEIDRELRNEMTDRTLSGNGKTDLLQEGIHDHVMFAAPCYRKKDSLGGASYGMMLITQERVIIAPLSSEHIHSDVTDTAGNPSSVKQETLPESVRARNSSRLESLEILASGYKDKSADKILHEEKDAWVLRFEDIEEIVITRVRTDSRSSRWLSILFAFFPLEPAAARYRVDYQLLISTTEQEYTLFTPFSITLKQTLVDHLGNRVSERIDDYAPLL